VPLNPDGRRQAESLARGLAAVPIDRIVSSDLRRCTETSSILIAGRGLAVETRESLREVRPGRLADLPGEDVSRHFLGAFSGFDHQATFLGGESFGSLADRVLGCFTSLLADTGWKRLVIVAHGGVNRVILAQAISPDLKAFGAFEQDPGCVNILDVMPDSRCLLRLVNATPYDELKAGLELTTMERLYHEYHAGKRGK
jgi:probable phosphoglycerate mutase